MVICLERDADLHMAQLMPLPLPVSCFSEIQTGFTVWVLAHPGSPGQRAVKRRVCVTFRPLSETFVWRSCSINLPVVATVVMWRGKKSVVRVAHCIAVLVPVHRTPSLLSDVHCFLNPSDIPLSDSISRIVDSDQLITWLLMLASSVKADLFCSDKLDRRWLPANGLLVLPIQFARTE